MKNKLIVIGYLGSNQCYLNVPREEAQKRFVAHNPEYSPEEVEEFTREFEFNDEFWAYDAQVDN